MGDPLFPITFLVRNFMVLSREPAWKALPLRTRRVRALDMVYERSRVFLEVREWMDAHRKVFPEIGIERFRREELAVLARPASYCDHCGGCCELRSGLPDFPAESPIPDSWKSFFGNGLGRDHRFCAFLWEVRGSGISFCSIHPFRSYPCRVFEQEECDYFKKDEDYVSLSGRNLLKSAYLSFFRLIGG